MVTLRAIFRLVFGLLGTVFAFGVIGPAIGYLAVVVGIDGLASKNILDSLWLGYFAGLIPAIIAGLVNFVSITFMACRSDEYEFPNEGLLWGTGAFAGMTAYFVIAAVLSFSPFTPKAIAGMGVVSVLAGAVCGRVINSWAWRRIHV